MKQEWKAKFFAKLDGLEERQRQREADRLARRKAREEAGPPRWYIRFQILADGAKAGRFEGAAIETGRTPTQAIWKARRKYHLRGKASIRKVPADAHIPEQYAGRLLTAADIREWTAAL